MSALVPNSKLLGSRNFDLIKDRLGHLSLPVAVKK